jgi:2-phosphoglycerate kinase
MAAEPAQKRFAPDEDAPAADGLVARWLTAAGLTDDRARELAGRWREFEALDQPLVVLIGGGTGVGKSTIATRVAYSLGITRVSSTDFIRQVLRSVVPEAIAPELSRSSFELDLDALSHGAGRHAEFERQAEQVMVGVRATIERAAAERMPLIIEGIHLLPELVDADLAGDGLLVYAVLRVEDEDDHSNRFVVRAQASERPACRYRESLQRIRDLQDHVVATAGRTGTPVIPNGQVDAAVRDVLDLVFAAIDGVVPPRQLKPVPR